MSTTTKNPNDSTYLSEVIPQLEVPVSKDNKIPLKYCVVKDVTVNPVVDLGNVNPFPTDQTPNQKNDFVSGTAAGTTATTATFRKVNTLEVIMCLPVTSGATTITLTGTTTGKIIYKLIMPTTTVIQNVQGLRIQPCLLIGTPGVP
jgi:hypothetical protein